MILAWIDVDGTGGIIYGAEFGTRLTGILHNGKRPDVIYVSKEELGSDRFFGGADDARAIRYWETQIKACIDEDGEVVVVDSIRAMPSSEYVKMDELDEPNDTGCKEII